MYILFVISTVLKDCAFHIMCSKMQQVTVRPLSLVTVAVTRATTLQASMKRQEIMLNDYVSWHYSLFIYILISKYPSDTAFNFVCSSLGNTLSLVTYCST